MCSSILPYSTAQLPTGGSCTNDAESSVSQVQALLSADAFSDRCRAGVSYLVCGFQYLGCSNTFALPPSPSVCATINSNCSPMAFALLTQAGVNITQLCGMSAASPATYPAPSVLTTPPLARCEAVSSSACVGINYPVYIAAGSSVAALGQLLKQFDAAFMPYLGPQCRDALSAAACSYVYRRCDEDALRRATFNTVNVAVPLPRFPSQSICQTVNTQCAPLLAAFPSLATIFNCSSVGGVIRGGQTCSGVSTPGLVDFPSASTAFAQLGPAVLATDAETYTNLPAGSSVPKYVGPGVADLTWVPNPPPPAAPGTCEPIPPTSFCYDLLPYKQFHVLPGFCPRTMESTFIASIPTVLSASAFNAGCRAQLAFLFCSRVYAPCANCSGAGPNATYPNACQLPMKLQPCRDDCNDALGACASDPNALKMVYGVIGLNLNGGVCPALSNDRNVCITKTPSAPVQSPKTATCVQFKSTVCDGVDYPIWVPAGMTAMDLEQAAAEKGVASFVPLPPGHPCPAALAKMICPIIFHRCDNDALRRFTRLANDPAKLLDVDLPLPRFPCQSLCADFRTKCAPLIASIPDLDIPCNAKGIQSPATLACNGSVITPGMDDFPVARAVFTADGSLSTECEAYASGPAPVRIGGDPQIGTWVPRTVPGPLPGTTATLRPGTDFCATVLPYQNVFVPANASLNALGAYFSILPTMLSAEVFTTNCRNAVSYILCARVHPPAGDTTYKPCQEDCATVTQQCSITELKLLVAAGLNFAGSICPVLPSAAATPAQCFARPALAPVPKPALPYCASGFKSNICGNLDYDIYVPAGMTPAMLEAQLDQKALRILFNVNMGPCRAVTARYLCSRVFMPCDKDALNRATNLLGNVPVPLPRLPCRGLCDAFSNFCSAVWTGTPLAPNCSTTGFYIPGQEDFPTTGTVFGALGPVTLATSCNDLQQTSKASGVSVFSSIDVPVQCPGPLVKPDDPADRIDGLECALPCPAVIFNKSEWDVAVKMVIGLGTVSVFCCAFLVLTWSIFPTKRQQRHILYFAISIFIVSVIILAGTSAGRGRDIRNTPCRNNAHGYEWEDGGFCSFQHIMLIQFTNSAVMWWMIISFTLFIRVVTGLNRLPIDFVEKNKDVIFHILAWGIPGIWVILVLAYHGTGGTGSAPWCIGNATSREDLDWITLYYPLAVKLILGAVFMISTLAQILITSLRTGKTELGLFIRPLFFVAGYLILFILLIQFRITAKLMETQVKDSVVDMVKCFFNPSADSCLDYPSTRPSPSAWYALLFSVSAQGIVGFLFYGVSTDNFVLWGRLLMCKSIDGKARGMYSAQSAASSDSRSGASKSSKANANTSSTKKSGAAASSTTSSAAKGSVAMAEKKKPATAATSPSSASTTPVAAAAPAEPVTALAVAVVATEPDAAPAVTSPEDVTTQV